MTEIQFKNLLAFAMLMSGGNILSKSPGYIIEKASRYISLKAIISRNEFDWGLHPVLKLAFDAYCEEWRGHIKALNK